MACNYRGREALMTTSAAFARHEHAILEGIARGHALHDSLTAIVRLVEEQAGGMFCSILLLDEDGLHVRTGAAPSLPSELMRQFDGQEIGPAAGSCGTAAFRRERVIVDDIATHPYWELYKTAVLPHGLRACWSTPIFDATGDVLGTFAMYYNKVHRPSPEEITWVDTATNLASIAISRSRTDTLLRRSAAKAMRLTRLYAASWIVRDSIIRGEAEVDFADVLCNVLVSSGIVPIALAAPRDSDTPTFAPAMHVVDPGSAA